MVVKTVRETGIIIFIGVLALGYYEAVVGLLQWLGFMPSLHPEYPFTGTFYNPGPYACFLSIVIPVAVYAMEESNHRLTKFAGMGMVLLGAILIPATLSRTALAACALGCMVALGNRLQHFIRNLRKEWMLTGVLLVAVAAAGLYMVKKDSADGRLLMWKVAAETAIDAPLSGTGWDNVAGAYGEMQERYFASGRGSDQEKMVADAPEYVFNEYLQVAIAFGLVAALAMLALIAGGFIAAFRNRQYGFAGSIAAAAVVMFASYPFQFPISVVLIAMVVCSGYVSATPVAVKAGGCLATMLAAGLFLTNSRKTDVTSDFSVALSLHRQGNYRKSNTYLMKLMNHSGDPMILNIIGKNYQALGMPDSAVYYLRKSTFRCPNRMYSHYLLMKLYNDSVYFDVAAGLKEARIILDMKVKVDSPAVADMRREAKNISFITHEKD